MTNDATVAHTSRLKGLNRYKCLWPLQSLTTPQFILILAAFKSNVDVVCYIPISKRDFSSKLKLMAICTFDVNMPGDDVENFKSGVTGDTILEGMLRVGEEIEVRLILSARTSKAR
ncbi:hypothetical protein KXD40_009601 [Peronospora effusa]|nr:hypothetical protein KXD40_009601 [Peronospora effusa]